LGMSLGKRSDLGMRGLGKKSSDLGMKMGKRWDLV
jgi:hypothetical protein